MRLRGVTGEHDHVGVRQMGTKGIEDTRQYRLVAGVAEPVVSTDHDARHRARTWRGRGHRRSGPARCRGVTTATTRSSTTRKTTPSRLPSTNALVLGSLLGVVFLVVLLRVVAVVTPRQRAGPLRR